MGKLQWRGPPARVSRAVYSPVAADGPRLPRAERARQELNPTGAGVSASIGGAARDFTAADKHDFVSLCATEDLRVGTAAVNAPLHGTFGFEKCTVTVNGMPASTFKGFAQGAGKTPGTV